MILPRLPLFVPSLFTNPPRVRALLLTLGLGACAVSCKDDAGGGLRTKEREEIHVSDHDEPNKDPDNFESSDCRSWAELDPASLTPLPESPYRASFEAVWETLRGKYYDPTLGCLDWPALRTHFGAKVAQAKDLSSAYASINAMLSYLRQSHLHATAPVAAANTRSGPGRAPLKLRLIAGEVIVVDNAVGGNRSSIPNGAEIRAIEGESIVPMVRELAQDVDKRGGTTTELAVKVARKVSSKLLCAANNELKLRYVAKRGGAEQEITQPCFVASAQDRVTLGHLQDVPTEVKAKMMPRGEVGYLWFNVWMLPMKARLVQALSELKAQGMKRLVLDLRGNPGGVGAMVMPVGRLFFDKEVELGELRMRALTQRLRVMPSAADEPFLGPMVILVDEGSASTSEIFALGMQALGRAHIVGGGPSAGMALPSLIDSLPDGGLFQYVVGDFRGPNGGVAEGGGVRPDLGIRETREAFAAGKDPVLEAAVSYVQTDAVGKQP